MKFNQTEYTLKYAKEKYKRVPLDLKIEDCDKLKEHVTQMNESINGFIKRAISETIVNDLKPPTR